MGSRVSLRPGNGGGDYARRTNMDPYASLLDQGLGDQHAAAEHEQEDHHRRDELQPMLILHVQHLQRCHDQARRSKVEHRVLTPVVCADDRVAIDADGVGEGREDGLRCIPSRSCRR